MTTGRINQVIVTGELLIYFRKSVVQKVIETIV